MSPEVQQYLKRVTRMITKDHHRAEDLFQDTMLRAFVHKDKYTPGNMKGWLTYIARNHYLSQMRRKKWHGGSIDDVSTYELPRINASQDIRVEWEDTLKAISELSKDWQHALFLTAEGLSLEDIAKECNISLGTAKSRVARARMALKELLS